MKAIYRDGFGKTVLNTDVDTCIIQAPRAPPGTGNRFIRGHDLYLHAIRKRPRDKFYYILAWDIEAGTELIYAVDLEIARQFVENPGGIPYMPDPKRMCKIIRNHLANA